MGDRLAELVRQRARMQEHLAWLDREIALAGQPAAAAESKTGDAPRLAPIAPAAVGPAALPSEAETILAQHRAGSDTVRQNVRRGCFLYFAAALLMLTLLVTVLYFTVGSR